MGEFEISQFKEKFIKESRNLLNDLEKDLLELENNPSDRKIIESAFRAMHTLKGVGSMYGFDNISNYTHKLENIYDAIREGDIELTTEIFNLSFNAVDHLRNLLVDEDFANSENADTHKIHISAFDEIIAEAGRISLELAEETEAFLDFDKKLSTWYILIRNDDNLLERKINLLNMYRDLSVLGEYKLVKRLIDNKNKNKGEYWSVFLATSEERDDIERVFFFILDEVKITKISDNNILNNKELQEEVIKILEEENTENEVLITDAIAKLQSSKKEKKKTEIKEQKKRKIEKEKKAVKIVSSKNKLLPFISVNTAKLDRLMYLVSEFVTAKSELVIASEKGDLAKILLISERFEDLSRYFRDNVLEIRLVSIRQILLQFKRLIRDLSQSLGKKVDFIIRGEDTELDKNILDTIAEPIMHLIRNALDHGIEKPDVRHSKGKPKVGTVKFESYQSGNYIYIEISDDGNGINPDKIRNKAIEKGLIDSKDELSGKQLYNLIFKPGFSTAKSLTGVSGRGVGMDIVKNKIKDIQGDIEINSTPGEGTVFKIKLQQTVSIIDTLLLRLGKSYYTIPVGDVEICTMDTHENITSRQDKRLVYDNNKLIPYMYLREIFDEEGKSPEKEKIIIVRKQKKRYALIVDAIMGEHQAVVKPIGKMLKNEDYLSGGSILGNGELAFMLNTDKLIESQIKKNFNEFSIS